MAGEEAVEGPRTRVRSWQMETYAGNEEEQEQETTQGEGGRGGQTGAREGGEDSRAVRDVVKKQKTFSVSCLYSPGWMIRQNVTQNCEIAMTE